MASDVTILNVRLPQEIVDWIDDLVDKGIYGNRSEAIRDYLRGYILQHQKQ